MGRMALGKRPKGSLNSLPSAMDGETEALREERARLRSSSQSVAVWARRWVLHNGGPPLPSLSSWGGGCLLPGLAPAWAVDSLSLPWACLPVCHATVACQGDSDPLGLGALVAVGSAPLSFTPGRAALAGSQPGGGGEGAG